MTESSQYILSRERTPVALKWSSAADYLKSRSCLQASY